MSEGDIKMEGACQPPKFFCAPKIFFKILDRQGEMRYTINTPWGYFGGHMEEQCCCGGQERKTVRSAEDKKSIIARLNRISGQVSGVRRMVEEDRYCDDILVQLAAVDASVKSLSAFILKKHLHGCVAEHVKEGDTDVLDEIVDLFRRFS